MARKGEKHQNQHEAEILDPVDKPKKKANIAVWLLAVLSFGLYLNTLTHDYCLDDKIAITHNEFTKEGVGGINDLMTTDYMTGFFGRQKNLVAGGRYRPLSPVTFAIEWELFGRNPGISHFINAVMYAWLVIVLYHFLILLFNSGTNSPPWYKQKEFWMAMVFALHPLHTEVVANIKGRDEIMGLIGALYAARFALKSFDTQQIKYAIYAVLAFFLALMSKETGVTFVAVVPLAIVFFRKWNWKMGLVSSATLLAGLIPYLLLRYASIGSGTAPIVEEIMNDPFLHASTSDKFATIMYTFGLYLKLLVVPHPLTHDYYPFHIPILSWMDWQVLLALVSQLALVGLGLYFTFVKKNVYGFAILFYFATFSIVSNVVFPIGTFMNERFMFVPSIAFAMVVVELIFKLNSIERSSISPTKVVLIFSPFILLYGFKTIDRNAAWKDDFTLSTTDVKTSINSAKVLMSAGGALSDRAATLKKSTEAAEKQRLLKQSEEYLSRSLELYPTYIQPMMLMGINQYRQGHFDTSIQFFENCLKINPNHEHARTNLRHLGDTLVKLKEFKWAIAALETLTTFDKQNVEAYASLSEIYGRYLGDLPKAEMYGKKGFDLDPTNTNIVQKLGIIQAMQGRRRQAINTFSKGLKADPDNAHVMMNLGVTYRDIGIKDSGEYYLTKAFELNPELKKGMR